MSYLLTRATFRLGECTLHGHAVIDVGYGEELDKWVQFVQLGAGVNRRATEPVWGLARIVLIDRDIILVHFLLDFIVIQREAIGKGNTGTAHDPRQFAVAGVGQGQVVGIGQWLQTIGVLAGNRLRGLLALVRHGRIGDGVGMNSREYMMRCDGKTGIPGG